MKYVLVFIFIKKICFKLRPPPSGSNPHFVPRFNEVFVRLIMECVTSLSSVVLIYGEKTRDVKPNKGLLLPLLLPLYFMLGSPL